MRHNIVMEATQYGGRLRYYGHAADSAYWDALWQGYVAMDYARYEAGHLPRFLKQTFLRYVLAGARVLEAGCGTGWFTVAANARGFRAEGVDFALEVIARLRPRFPHIPFFSGDVRDMRDTTDETYDALFSPGVCEHFEEGPDDVLLEARRILRAGGILLVSTPTVNALHRALARVGAFRGPARGVFYQYAFPEGEMRAILARLGFRVLAVNHRGTLLTFQEQIPGVAHLPFGPLAKPVAVVLDNAPLTLRWGQSCLLVARKVAASTAPTVE